MKITDALRAEHTIFVTVFDQIERVLPSLTTPAEVRTMARIIEGILHSHASRESNLAYTALDHALAEEGHLDRMHADHHEIDRRLKKIDQASSVVEGRRLLKAAINSSREHFQLEEKTLFPMLERVLQQDTLQSLGRLWLERPAGVVQS